MHLERVRRSPQSGGSRDCEARWRWRRAPLRFVKMCQHQRQGVLLAAVLSRPLGAAQSALLRGASLWAAECGMHVIWPCGGVRPRKMRVDGRRLAEEGEEGHGSPIKCALLLFCFRSCDSSGHEKTPLAHPSPLPVPLTLPVLWFSLCVLVHAPPTTGPCGQSSQRGAAGARRAVNVY